MGNRFLPSRGNETETAFPLCQTCDRPPRARICRCNPVFIPKFIFLRSTQNSAGGPYLIELVVCGEVISVSKYFIL